MGVSSLPAAGRAVRDLIDRVLALSGTVVAHLEDKLGRPDLLTAREVEQYDRALTRQMRAATGLSAELRLVRRQEDRDLEAAGYSARRDLVLEWVASLPPEQRMDFLAAMARASGETPEGTADG